MSEMTSGFPGSLISALPQKGNWLRPIAMALAAGFVAGAVHGGQNGVDFRWMIIRAGMISVATVLLFGAILNGMLAALNKNPGIFRTVHFISIVSVFQLFGRVPLCLAGLYLIFHYARVAAGCSKKQAGILIGGLAGVVVLAVLGAVLALRNFRG